MLCSEPFCFAGPWTQWRSRAGEVVPSCEIVTCESNELARPIHHRMPVVLADPERWDAWLDPRLEAVAARELLEPIASERLALRANPVVNSARREGPDCLAAAA